MLMEIDQAEHRYRSPFANGRDVHAVNARRTFALFPPLRWWPLYTIAVPAVIAAIGCNTRLLYMDIPENETSAVIISPSTAMLYPSQTQQFTVSISGISNQAATWGISPGGVGTIDSTGLYTAPAAVAGKQAVAITATSVSTPHVSATVTITLLPLSMSIAPNTATLYPSQTQQFTASISGSSNQAMTWSISPAGAGMIDNEGLYTAPMSVFSQQTVTVTATSMATPQLSETATITLLPQSMSISPGTAILYPSQAKQFTVSISGVSNQAATWSISPGGAGTIDSTGLYTAPTSFSSRQTVIVTATSVIAPQVSATATITLLPPSMTISPSTAMLYPGQSQQFTVSITGSSNQAAAWSISPAGAGTVDNTGLYTAPASLAGQQAVTVTAISQADPWLSANATISDVPEASVSLESEPIIGLDGLCGAFTDGNGSVIEPIAIGAKPRLFVVPPGATQLQLGINDDLFADNLGAGFEVQVNGTTVEVPPTAMPWLWNANGLNQLYPFGAGDGTAPIVAATQLSAGNTVSIQYLSGTAQAGDPSRFLSSDADGQLDWITGTRVIDGGYPSRYMTDIEHPVGETVPLAIGVTDALGNPLADTAVEVTMTGANAQTLQATTDATGAVALSYQGSSIGTDSISAAALLNGQTFANTPSQTNIIWVGQSDYSIQMPLGSLSVSIQSSQVATVGYTTDYQVVAQDSSGNPLRGLSVTVQVIGANPGTSTLTTDTSGLSSGSFTNVSPGVSFVVAYGVIDGMPVFSMGTPVAALSTALLPNAPVTLQGVISGPLNDSLLLRSAPIAVSFDEALDNGTLYLLPVTSPNLPATSIPVSGTAALLDVSQFPGSEYWILLIGQGSNGESVNSLVMVNLQ